MKGLARPLELLFDYLDFGIFVIYWKFYCLGICSLFSIKVIFTRVCSISYLVVVNFGFPI